MFEYQRKFNYGSHYWAESNWWIVGEVAAKSPNHIERFCDSTFPWNWSPVWWGQNNGTHWAPRIQHPFSMSPKQTQEKVSPKGFRSNLGNMSPLVIYQFAMKAMAHLVRWSKWFPISKLVNNQRESWFIKRNIASIKNAPVFFMVINQWSLINGFPIFPICFFLMVTSHIVTSCPGSKVASASWVSGWMSWDLAFRFSALAHGTMGWTKPWWKRVGESYHGCPMVSSVGANESNNSLWLLVIYR